MTRKKIASDIVDNLMEPICDKCNQPISISTNCYFADINVKYESGEWIILNEEKIIEDLYDMINIDCACDECKLPKKIEHKLKMKFLNIVILIHFKHLRNIKNKKIVSSLDPEIRKIISI